MESLSLGLPSALSASISFSQDSGEKGHLEAQVGTVEGVAWVLGAAEELWHSHPELAPLLSRTRRRSLSGAARGCRQRPASRKGPPSVQQLSQLQSPGHLR